MTGIGATTGLLGDMTEAGTGEGLAEIGPLS